MNTIESVLARRAKQAATSDLAAALRAANAPKPKAAGPKRKPGRPPTHGHKNAYWRHIEAGEKPCDPCIAAHEAEKARMRERFHERKAAG